MLSRKGDWNMDNIQFGAFVAQLRKEQGLTQRDLADRLHVTDKAVSKWETGRGFPDVKLLEPLAQVLEVSLVELLQGARTEKESLTIGEAGEVLSQAIDQSQRITTRRYLRLLRWLLTAICVCLAYGPVMFLRGLLQLRLLDLTTDAACEIIGGADGPTAVLVATSSFLPIWFWPLIQATGSVLCLVLAIRVCRLERNLHRISDK